MKPRARDFVDIYFIIKKKSYNLADLVLCAKTKFDWHLDPIQLGPRFLLASKTADHPRMIKKSITRTGKISLLRKPKNSNPKFSNNDGSLAAHFEHTVAVTPDGHLGLTEAF